MWVGISSCSCSFFFFFSCHCLLTCWLTVISSETWVLQIKRTQGLSSCWTDLLNWPNNAETKNTWHRPDPSFTYLLSFFLLLTGLAWGVAYTSSFGAIVRLSLLFVFVHFIGSSLLVSTLAYFVIGRIFGPNGAAASLTGFRGSRGRRRGAAQGLFVQAGEKDQLEFGYCFDVGVVHLIEYTYIHIIAWN